METEPISLKTVLAVTVIVSAVELAARIGTEAAIAASIILTGVARIFVAGLLLVIAGNLPQGMTSIGLARSHILYGLKRGLLWSAAFGVLAGVGLLVCALVGITPLGLLKVPLPKEPVGVLIYFLVGAGLAPVTEELYFRGFLYGWLRRWGPAAAVIGSTLLFIAAHPNMGQIPLTQLVGGLVFAISYEIEKSLMVPITIHACGNLALFSLSLFF